MCNQNSTNHPLQKLVQVEALYRETANEYHQLYEKLGTDASSSSNSAREEALINAVSKAKAEAKELEELFVQEKVNLAKTYSVLELAERIKLMNGSKSRATNRVEDGII